MKAETFNKAKELAAKINKYESVKNALDETNSSLAGLPFRHDTKPDVSSEAVKDFLAEDWPPLRKTLEMIIRAAIKVRIENLQNEFEKL